MLITDEFIKIKKNELIALGSQLHKESTFARAYISNNKKTKSVISWFKQILSLTIYGTFLIQNLIDNFDKYKDKPVEQIDLYTGKIAISSFLDIINAFELSTNQLVNSSIEIQKLLNERIDRRINIIDDSWKPEVNKESRKLKKNIKRDLSRKKYEMKFIRDTLYKHKIINELDKRILDFSWDIRNSMHNNFLAIKDISFAAPGSSLDYVFNFKKGEELYHPKDLLSFYSMTEQIIFIQLKVLEYFDKD